MSDRFNAPFFSGLLFCFCTICAGVTFAGIGGPYGEYSLAYEGPETLTLLVIPDGSGDPFDQATTPFGSREDGTITLVVLDAGDQPVPGFPREDLWLQSYDGGLATCLGGTIADTATDAEGRTRWTRPLFAGGSSQALTEVLINGSPPELTVGVKLSFNSPDINGDLAVDLMDLQLFANDFFGTDDFRSDFYRDGEVNLSDLSAMARAYGARCP